MDYDITMEQLNAYTTDAIRSYCEYWNASDDRARLPTLERKFAEIRNQYVTARLLIQPTYSRQVGYDYRDAMAWAIDMINGQFDLVLRGIEWQA